MHSVPGARSALNTRASSFALAFALTVALACLTAAPAFAGGNSGHHPHANAPKVKVLTRNMYFGADLTRAITATSIPDFLAANAQIWTNVVASDIDARARAVAREIAFNGPDLVGLQEASQWLSGTFADPAPATTLEYDQVASLLAWLSAYGTPYEVVKSQEQISIEAPASAPYFRDFRLVDRDVILVRKHSKKKLALSNAAGANFATALPIPSITGETIVVKRGWVSVDVKTKSFFKHGQSKFRFINTHLESFHPLVRAAQAGELVAPTGPAGSTTDNVVLVGDINSDPLEAPPGNAAIGILIGAGFADTWTAANPGDPGYTCCFTELLDDPSPVGLFNQRIDHVLTRGAIGVKRSKLVGLSPFNRTSGGLWPSDHAGVLTTLRP